MYYSFAPQNYTFLSKNTSFGQKKNSLDKKIIKKNQKRFITPLAGRPARSS